jgi:hypothetical protein
MQNIANKTFCTSTAALFQRAITSGDRNDSECVGTNTDSCLIFMVVKYGLPVGVISKQRDQKKYLDQSKMK